MRRFLGLLWLFVLIAQAQTLSLGVPQLKLQLSSLPDLCSELETPTPPQLPSRPQAEVHGLRRLFNCAHQPPNTLTVAIPLCLEGLGLLEAQPLLQELRLELKVSGPVEDERWFSLASGALSQLPQSFCPPGTGAQFTAQLPFMLSAAWPPGVYELAVGGLWLQGTNILEHPLSRILLLKGAPTPVLLKPLG
jgi:hypothetical protein